MFSIGEKTTIPLKKITQSQDGMEVDFLQNCNNNPIPKNPALISEERDFNILPLSGLYFAR